MNKRIRRNICLILITGLILSGSLGATDLTGVRSTVAKTRLRLSAKTLELAPGKKTTIRLSGLSWWKDNTWTISDKKILKLVKKTRKTIRVQGKKEGTATVRAKVGKKSLTCRVTVRKPGSGGTEYQSFDKFAQALSELQKTHTVQSSAAIAATDPFFTGRLVIKGKSSDLNFSDTNPAAVLQSDDRIYILQYDSSAAAKAAFQTIAGRDDIEWAEPDIYIGTDDGYAPDLRSGEPAGLEASRESARIPSPDMKLDATALSWGVSRMNADSFAAKTSKNEITVAVIDTGVSSHPFLSGRLVSGYDFVNNDYDPSDEHYHGTHVAGTIVDCTPNLNVKIMPVRVLNANGSGSTAVIASGIRYAVDHGAKVINMSLGGGHSSYTDEYVKYAVNHGVTVVVAAGNEYSNTASFCPAHITDAVVVGAINTYENKADFSNYGNSLDVVAPGVDIESCIPGGSYASLDGTSMATPHIAAVAAMLLLHFPGATPTQVESRIKSCCRDLGTSGWDMYYGSGIPDLNRVDTSEPMPTVSPTKTPTPTKSPTPTKTPVVTRTPQVTTAPTRTPVTTYNPWPTTAPTVRPTWPTYTPAPIYTYPPIYTSTPIYTYTPWPTMAPITTPIPGGVIDDPAGLKYRVLGNGTALITGYSGSGGTLVIPFSIGGYSISGISDRAFYGNTNITTVRIEGSPWIGESAFASMTGLKQVNIKGMVTGVYSSAFSGSSLTTFNVSGMLFQVEKNIFSGCTSLKNANVSGMIDQSVIAAFNACPSLTNKVITGLVGY